MLTAAFAALLVAVVFRFQAVSFPMTVRGAGRWSLGFVLLAAAGLARAVLDGLGSPAEWVLPVVLAQGGLIAIAAGLFQLHGLTYRIWFWGAPAPLALLGLLWFTLIEPRLWGCVLVSAGTALVLLAPSVWLIVRAPQGGRARRFSEYWSAIGALLLAALGGLLVGWAVLSDAARAGSDGSGMLARGAWGGAVALAWLASGLILLSYDRLKDELEYLVSHDVLTGAYSRRGFVDLAEAEVSRALRLSRSVAVLMVDLDRFKLVNDYYGPAVGDTVLKRFVEIANSVMRREDIVGRYGGEEFVVLLPETPPTAARVVAERIRVAVAASRVVVGSRNIRFTVSVGIANVVAGVGMDELLAQADSAMRLAKSRGRNRVEMA